MLKVIKVFIDFLFIFKNYKGSVIFINSLQQIHLLLFKLTIIIIFLENYCSLFETKFRNLQMNNNLLKSIILTQLKLYIFQKNDTKIHQYGNNKGTYQ